jgi:hypothetical protein
MTSFFEQVAAWLLGEAISAPIPATPTPEGLLNASLGAVAAFFGLVSLMVATPAVVLSFHSGPFGPEPLLLVVTLFPVVAACGALGVLAGRRAPRVTKRNLALARVGSGACMLAIAGSVVAVLVCAARTFF